MILRSPTLSAGITLMFCLNVFACGKNEGIPLPGIQSDTRNVAQTAITPYLDHQLEADQNLLWCATFQLAWDELCQFNQGALVFQNEHPLAALLNQQDFAREDLPEDSYLVMASLVEADTLSQLRQACRSLFGTQADDIQLLDGSVPTGAWMVYACLFRELPFAFPFDRIDNELAFQGNIVKAFGIKQYLSRNRRETRMAEQVQIYPTPDPEDFLVEILTRQQNDRLILAKVHPQDTLLATVKMVLELLESSKPEPLQVGDRLLIPLLDFDLHREYGELYGNLIKSADPRLDGTSIEMARQRIRFRLDEGGALLKSEALIAAAAGRQLHFNEPFLILLQKRNARLPYLAIWVGNTNLMAF